MYQKQGGCEDSPGAVQAVAGEHGAHAAVLFANVPTGHVAAVYAQAVAPWVLEDLPAQGRHETEELAPAAVEKVPAGHGVHVEGATAPT